jgi:hypothetical protein
LLEGVENSSIWRTPQEDQDRSILHSCDLETRTGQKMKFQKRQVIHKRSPKFHPVILLLPTKLSLDELKDKAAYITFTLQK